MKDSNLPDYKALFGELDFKQGDEARSVYSPAAYLADLLQLMEDEFNNSDDILSDRRTDIRNLLLNSENTYDLIPYLDIVNEVIENKLGEKTKKEENKKEVYENILLNATYPFNTPFNLAEEELKLYLKYLGISAEDLYKLFATTNEEDNEDIDTTIAREYLRLSEEELEFIITPLNENSIKEAYGVKSSDITELDQVSVFLQKTSLSGTELRELLFQNLSEKEKTKDILKAFFLNSFDSSNGYADLDSEEKHIKFNDGDNNLSQIPGAWFDRTRRFVALAKKINISFTDLDLILRFGNKKELNNDSIQFISNVIKLHKATALPIDEVISLLATVNEQGHSEEEMPQDLFSSIFNNKYIEQDNNYIPPSNGIVPHQFSDKKDSFGEVETVYEEMLYEGDLFAENNYYFRKRITHALGIKESDLEKIIQRLDDKEIDNSFWTNNEIEDSKKREKQAELLNFLYRFVKLSEVLDLTHEEVFTLWDLLEQDPSILSFNQHNTFLNQRPANQDCYAIFLSDNINDRIWLVESLHSLVKWMLEYDFTPDLLWYIATGKFRSEKAEKGAKDLTISQLNAMIKAFEEVKLSPASLQKGNIDDRMANIIYHKLKGNRSKKCKHHIKLVDRDDKKAKEIAASVIPALAQVTPMDFKGLGIEEPLVEKISKNLIYKGYTSIGGIILSESLPEREEDFMLETDFSYYLKAVFGIIHQLYIDAESNIPSDEEVVFSVYLSDLKNLRLNKEELQELYDNLIFNHYIDEEGSVKFSSFFSNPNNWHHFDVNTHIQEHADEVSDLLKLQVDKFHAKRIKITASSFDILSLTEIEVTDLLDNLSLNGYIDNEGYILDKAKVMSEDKESLRLALQFYPHRKEILNVLHSKLNGTKKEYLALDKTHLAKIADTIIAQWAFTDLQGNYLNGNNIQPIARPFFNDEENKEKLILGYYFESSVGVTIFNRMQHIIESAEKYQFTDKPLVDMKFYQAEIDELMVLMESMGLLTWSHHIPEDKLEYLLNSDHAISFDLRGFEDFNEEIFFMLQGIAKETVALQQEIVKKIIELANNQDKLLWEHLNNIFGLDIESLKTISEVLFEGQDKKAAWLLPAMRSANALGELTNLPKHKAYNKTFQRVRQYSVLANKLQMGEKETAIAFHDQDLAAKFPEALELPDGVEKIDVLLESEQFVYLFASKEYKNGYWTYRRSDYELVDYHELEIDTPSNDLTGKDKEIIKLLREDDALRKTIKDDPIRHLFEKKGPLEIDAAFYDTMDNLYIVSGKHYYSMNKLEECWEEKANPFGEIDNDFENTTTIDAAYVDTNGRLFLFAQEMYVRYTKVDNEYIDEGYPKNIQKDWADENVEVNWPEIFTGKVDAAFEGKDGVTYFFHGQHFVSSEDKQIKPINEQWGKLKHDLARVDKIDASFVYNGMTFMLIGEQVLAYRDSLENRGLQLVEGFPKAIGDCFFGLPHEFKEGVDSAFILEVPKEAPSELDNPNLDGENEESSESNTLISILFLTKNEKQIILIDDSVESEVTLSDYYFYNVLLFEALEGNGKEDLPIKNLWGKLNNPIKDLGSVDASMVGLDGYTYLFSGDVYYRYKTGDYSHVDAGYPRSIAEDWEGITQVDAAFVLDGKTYIFGRRPQPEELSGDGKINPVFHELLAENEINEHEEEISSEYVYIRYSTRGYTEMDEKDEDDNEYITPVGNLLDVEEIEVFPAPQTDIKWWSLPQSAIDAGFEKVDAVLNAHDGKTYMFFSKKFENIPLEINPAKTETRNSLNGLKESYVLEFEHTHRWWETPISNSPLPVKEKWDRLPFDYIDAAVAGKDGKTYLFSGEEYVSFSDAEVCEIENGYPRKNNKFWGEIKNNIIENCQIDAAVVLESREMDEDSDGDDIRKVDQHLYLFSGDQFFRYEIGNTNGYTLLDTIFGSDNLTMPPFVELGYPKPLSELKHEPRFKHLKASPKHVDAIIADFRNTYLFEGRNFHIISDVQNIVYKSESTPEDYKVNIKNDYPEVVFNRSEFATLSTFLLEDGSVYGLYKSLDNPDNNLWKRISSLEGNSIEEEVITPRIAKDAKEGYKTTVDTILQGTDGNTYYFNDKKCYDRLLDLEYPIVKEWGKPKNTIDDKERIDSAFVGRDGKTYVFSGSQYYTYNGDTYIDQTPEGSPKSIRKDWGLDNIAHAFVIGNETYLFEAAGIKGNFKYAIYKTDDYLTERPKVHYDSFHYWGIPQAQQLAGFNRFDSVYCQGDNLIFVKGQEFIRYHLIEKNWSMPKDLDLLYSGLEFNKTTFQSIHSAFEGKDGSMYFFDGACFVHYKDGGLKGIETEKNTVAEVENHWGIQKNPFENRVNSAFVHNGITYLIGEEEYVRYSTSDYRDIDEDYPKKIAEDLLSEEPFMYMGKHFECAVKENPSAIKAVITNRRNTYVLLASDLYVGSTDTYATLRLSKLRNTQNNFLENGMVDAAFVKGEYTYLFSGDQYIRYSNSCYDYVDMGYPKLIQESLAEDLELSNELPTNFKYGIDAAFFNGTKYVLFKDEEYWDSEANMLKPIEGNWGKINNNFVVGDAIDAAYTNKEGKLILFKGDQFTCYSNVEALFSDDEDVPKYMDAGYPMLIEDHSAHLPMSFTDNLASTFWFEDKLYFTKGNEYVLHKPGTKACDDRFYPQPFQYRWGNWSDYLLMDIYLLARFLRLNEQFTSSEESLSSLLYAKDGYTKEPFWALSEIFGFDKEEVRWVLRNNAFLSQTNAMEQDYQVESIVRLYDILSTAQRMKVDASKLYSEVWEELYTKERTYTTADKAAQAVRKMLGSMDYNDNYTALFDEIDRALNTIKRDVLVPYAIHNDDDVEDARDLYEKLLIDVQMENEASTSRIKEATMALQLFFHRYFLNLEDQDLKGDQDEESRTELKKQWEWMRNYRVWEANRKVFLYPENYIRPELRDEELKTPAFETLEEDLLQGEINDDNVLKVYKKYLDEFSEVSRLNIAGGYMYDQSDKNKKLVLFGRTKSDPYKYYYRFGDFINGELSNDSWEPWHKVNIPIDSEEVYPIYAFDRVFVFWAKVMTVPGDTQSTTLIDTENGDKRELSKEQGASKYTVNIYYSYYNLNKEWIQPQTLQTVFNKKDNLASPKDITDVELLVEFAGELGKTKHDNIQITCQYKTANSDNNKKPDTTVAAFALTPEMYSKETTAITFDNPGQEAFKRLFYEGDIEKTNTAVLSTSKDSVDAPWYAFDHKGGSFLCKPTKDDQQSAEAVDNEKNNITAAFEYNSKKYFFTKDGKYSIDNGTPKNIQGNWGKGAEQTPVQYFQKINTAFDWDDGKTYLLDDEKCTIVTSENLAQGSPNIIDNNLKAVLNKLGYTSAPNNLSNYKIAAAYGLLMKGIEDSYSNKTYKYPIRVHFSVINVDDNSDRKLFFLNRDRNNGNALELLESNNTKEVKFVNNSEDDTEWAAAFSMSSKIESSPTKEIYTYQYGFKGSQLVVTKRISQDTTVVGDQFSEPIEYEFSNGAKVRTLEKNITAAVKVGSKIYIFQEDEYIVINVPSEIVNPSDSSFIEYPDKVANAIDEWKNPIKVNTKNWVKAQAQPLTLNRIDAAYMVPNQNKLVLIWDQNYITYTLSNSDTIESKNVDGNEVKTLDATFNINAAFSIGDKVYLFGKDSFYELGSNSLPENLDTPKPIKGNWTNLPVSFASDIDAALNSSKKLTFYKADKKIEYDFDGDTQLKKSTEVKYEIVRLTSSTSKFFNNRLFQGGVEALLQLSTQQINEEPAFVAKSIGDDTINEDPKSIWTKAEFITEEKLPVGSHIDYQSANGIYYWEVFFHAPFLIAQALNNDQKFEEAKQWYEHIYDPTAAKYFWKFLPFQAVDIDALILAGSKLAEELSLTSTFSPIAQKLKEYDDEFSGISNPATLADLATYLGQNPFTKLMSDVLALVENATPASGKAQEFLEVLQVIEDLPNNYKAMQNTQAQLSKYLDDPFDPHAIAILRPIAYRKAIVMNYIDNFLDWGDMLFRQYSRESINEARMLYVFAYDLLGKKPDNLGSLILIDETNFEGLFHNEATPDEGYDFLLELENKRTVGNEEVITNDKYDSLTFAGTQHDSIANPYFFIPENGLFLDYWNRVEDRLFKIRNSLNITGEKQPLPLFQPPIDPMALVNAVASGGSISDALTILNTAVPHYRFSYMLDKAKAYSDKVAQFGGDLLAALEKKDAEELELLRNKQETNILMLGKEIKALQINDAHKNIKSLEQSLRNTENQAEHYKRLLKDGLLTEEITQLGLMAASATMMTVSAAIKGLSAIAHALPNSLLGIFITGVEVGGSNIGEALDKGSDALETGGDAVSTAGEILGQVAQHKRTFDDWGLQLKMALGEAEQLHYQIEAAKLQKAIAEHEKKVHEKEIENSKSIGKFMTDKFSNKYLYKWMSSKLSGLFFQSYKMAHDIAKQAEKAFQFETGTKEREVQFITGTYWDSQKKGLLSGESLGVELAHMEKAYMEQDSRGMEITKNISLLELDPMAFVQLKLKGSCMFRLSEEMFNHDFPGHYNRQIKNIAIDFNITKGKTVMATLTQLNNKLVMEPDTKAVKYLLDAKGEQPMSIRTDWKVNEQVALSYTDDYTENNGMFELRYDDSRYLPFEGTGAVSLWKLELNGKKGDYNLDELLDATIKIRYTADQGGDAFANAVRGMLKPYTESVFIDLAYSFPKAWNQWMQNNEQSFSVRMERSMFPNLVGSKLDGVYTKYEYAASEQPTLLLNNELQLNNNQYLAAGNLTIQRNGTLWTFTAKGDKQQLKNVELILLYKAKV